MLHLLWLIPALPLAGFLLLILFGRRLGRSAIAILGVGSVGLSAVVAVLVGASFIVEPPPNSAFSQTLWTWIQVGNLAPGVTFYLDALSLAMVLVVTFVGFLIHLYSAEFMSGEEGYSRFFAYMNLFVSSMLTLLLADNLLLLYLGWEGVGLCSYLLIGFWYTDPANGRAARKAFVVTRVGDAAMAIGLFLIFVSLGTLNIQPLMQRAQQLWPAGSSLAVAASALLLAGAVGKSAQLPLQVWLPDAMAGPTPVSALIHAATMVTAGVYLIARTHVLFSLAPAVQLTVAVVGAVTLVLAGFSALTQRDIKRVLAYSTISQVGYMFLALGVGAWSAAIFHFVTHAFFKALLFLGAGVVILAMHHEHDMFKMGGLRKQMPLTFWTFLIGAASLSAFPLATAGFYSKDLILWSAWSSTIGSPWLWAAGLLGALLTCLYTFRMVFVTFFGKASHEVVQKPGAAMAIPLVVLAFLSVVGGFIAVPDFLRTALPVPSARAAAGAQVWFQAIASVVSLLGILTACLLFGRSQALVANPGRTLGAALHRFWSAGWGFDRMYDLLFLRPFVWLAHINQNDVIDLLYTGVANLSIIVHRLLSRTQSGQVRRYAMGIALGAVIVVAIVVFL